MVAGENKLLRDLLCLHVSGYVDSYLEYKNRAKYLRSARCTAVKEALVRLVRAVYNLDEIVAYMVRHNVSKEEVMYHIDNDGNIVVLHLESVQILVYEDGPNATYRDLIPIMKRYTSLFMNDAVALLKLLSTTPHPIRDDLGSIMTETGYGDYRGNVKFKVCVTTQHFLREVDLRVPQFEQDIEPLTSYTPPALTPLQPSHPSSPRTP